MRGGFRAAALLVGLVLFAAGCTQSTSNTAGTSPDTTPSAQASPSADSSPSSSPGGGTNPTPSSAPDTSPSASPASPAKLIISSLSYHAGEVGIGYSPITANGAGGTAPYTWSIGGGSLPLGLALSPAGTVSGTPTVAGSYSFVVLLKDAAGQAAGVGRTITVAPPMVVTSSCVRICSVEAGCDTVCGAFGSIDGGLAPYRTSVIGGALPSGMNVGGLALTGVFPGPAPQNYTFSVSITDALGATSSVDAAFFVFPHIAFAGGSIGSGQVLCFWTGCSAQMPYSGGTPNASVSVQIVGWSTSSQCFGNPAPSPCPPPAQPTVVAKGGQLFFTVPSPGSTWINGYTATLTLVLIDQSPCGAGANCQSAPSVVTVTVQGG